MKKLITKIIINKRQKWMFIYLLSIFNCFIMLPYEINAQPVMEADINPGSADSEPSYFCGLNGDLLFKAYDPTYYRELWKFDDSGASLAANINPDWQSEPMYLTYYNGEVFFRANDGINGVELWAYDGTSAYLVSNINQGGGSYPEFFKVYNGILYFSAKAEGTQYGRELWAYNGVSVAMVYDIDPGNSDSNPSWLTVYDGQLFFQANHGSYGTELWKYDGAFVSLVQDAIPGIGSSSPKYLTVYNDELFFNAYDPDHGYELWKSDGSSMSLVCDINTVSGVNGYSSPEYLTVYNDELYFSANDGINGRELWKHNGSETSLVWDINIGNGAHSIPSYLTVYKGNLYFSADDETHGKEIMKYDGTAVSLVYDIDPTPGQGSDPKHLYVFDDLLFFQADDHINGAELWSYDGENVSLNIGYQIISSNLIPDDPDMTQVLSDILNENLDFVRNSEGNVLRKIGPVWVNGIGNWVTTEGYLVKMNSPDSFEMIGELIDPQTPIVLSTGYQFISYLPANPMDAIIAFNDILENIDFVRNSNGNMLRKIGPTWVNGIGDLNPQEGYLVKMNVADNLIYPE